MRRALIAALVIGAEHKCLRRGVGRIVTALAGKLEEYPGERDLAEGETWL